MNQELKLEELKKWLDLVDGSNTILEDELKQRIAALDGNNEENPQ